MSTDIQAAAPNTDETTPVAGDQIAIQVIAEYIAECAQITVEQATDQAIELVGRLTESRIACVALPEVAPDQFDDPAVRLGRDAKVVALDPDRITLIDIPTPFAIEQVPTVAAALLAVHAHVTEADGQ